MTRVTTSPRLAELLGDIGATGSLVGASLAVRAGGRVEAAAWGETRHGLGHPMTTKTVLQIGSITKVYTATIVMQLARESLIDLEASFRSYVPEFRPFDLALADSITVRDLLSHTSGLQADFVVDTGRGEDCLARFVEACAAIGQGPVGAGYEYCNAGYVLLGRLIEKVTGTGWDDALFQRILEPASLTETVTLPEQVLLHENAVGHFPVKRAGVLTWEVPPVWSVPRVGGPAGTICATAADVVRFAAHHLDEASDALLSAPDRTSMQVATVAVPDSLTDERCALGWHLRTFEGRELLGHTGGNMGQGGMLWIDKQAGTIVCLLVNGLGDTAIFDEVLRATVGSDALLSATA